MNGPAIVAVESPQHLQAVRDLFFEYGKSLAFHICFDDFQKEIDALPGIYAPPRGALFLALSGAEAVGCTALKPVADESCEMKRLYVRPAFRGQKFGRSLIETAIATARKMGYRNIRLDTLPGMKAARALYDSFGFRETGGDGEKIDLELKLF